MTKRSVTLTIDSEIYSKFSKQFENNSRKVEELMESCITNFSEREEIQNRLEELDNKLINLNKEKKILNKKLEKLDKNKDKEIKVSNFVEEQVKKFKRDYPNRWSSVKEFWEECGNGILNKADNINIPLRKDKLAERIKTKCENRVSDS